MQWANDTFSLREITQEGNPAVCTPWVPIHLSFNRSAGAASLCLSECAHLPWFRGEGHTRWRERVGESQFRRGDIHCGTLYSLYCINVLCGETISDRSFLDTDRPYLGHGGLHTIVTQSKQIPQIRKMQHLRKVRKSNKLFKSVNLRICDFRNLCGLPIFYVRKPKSFLTNRSLNKAGTIHFKFRGWYGVSQVLEDQKKSQKSVIQGFGRC
jgi:hypothetical protein